MELLSKLRICIAFLGNKEQENLQVTNCELCGSRAIYPSAKTKRPGLVHGQRQHITVYQCKTCGATCRCESLWEDAAN